MALNGCVRSPIFRGTGVPPVEPWYSKVSDGTPSESTGAKRSSMRPPYCSRSRRSLALLLIRAGYGPTPRGTGAPRAGRPCHGGEDDRATNDAASCTPQSLSSPCSRAHSIISPLPACRGGRLPLPEALKISDDAPSTAAVATSMAPSAVKSISKGGGAWTWACTEKWRS